MLAILGGQMGARARSATETAAMAWMTGTAARMRVRRSWGEAAAAARGSARPQSEGGNGNNHTTTRAPTCPRGYITTALLKEPSTKQGGEKVEISANPDIIILPLPRRI